MFSHIFFIILFAVNFNSTNWALFGLLYCGFYDYHVLFDEILRVKLAVNDAVAAAGCACCGVASILDCFHSRL